MQSLLCSLLYDLRQRCCHFRNELAQLLPNIPAEVLVHYSKVVTRVGRCEKQIEALLVDPDIHDARLASNYYYDYKRLTEFLNQVEGGPLLVLKRFDKDDLALNRVLSRICQEINFPYTAPLCASLSTEHYWTLTSMDLIFVPSTEPSRLLSLPDLYHELAHFLLDRDHKEFMSPILKRIDTYFARKMRESKQNGWPADSLARIEDRKRQWKTHWHLEFAADMLATYWCGPAFGWCNLRLCANLSTELFEAGDLHPADDARHAAVCAMLSKTGYSDLASKIETRWKELVSLASPTRPTEYELTYPPELFDAMSSHLFSVSQQMGLVQWSGLNAGTTHVTGLINAAWDEFHANPENFADFEGRELNKLRGDLGSTL